jgi:hypothetical protein
MLLSIRHDHSFSKFSSQHFHGLALCFITECQTNKLSARKLDELGAVIIFEQRPSTFQ